VALNLYRRHKRECRAGHSEQYISSEFEERKRGWKRCECPIVLSGTLQRKFKRVSTGQWEWAAARAIAAQREALGDWDQNSASPLAPIAETGEEHVKIERAINAFLAEREETLSPNTYRKNSYVLNSLKSYSVHKGYVLLSQWTPIDLREFRTSWGVAPNTATKYMEIVKSFFGFAVANKWIIESPAKLIRGARGKAANNQKERIPFSDEELQEMYDACEHRYGKTPIKWSREVHHRPAKNEIVNYRYVWTGEDVADFISVSTYTGLRISDVATFHADRLQKNGECHVRTTKTGSKVCTWIPEWLQERIRARSAKYGPLIFGAHETTNINTITDLWRRRLNRLWDLCGPWKSKPHPHRFRHTFARILLQKPGVTVRDVAELLGDTEDMVLRHYGAWVPERQERLSRILRDAFAEKPKPKIVTINRSR
jgi:integrase